MKIRKKILASALVISAGISLHARQLFTSLSSGPSTPYAYDPRRYYTTATIPCIEINDYRFDVIAEAYTRAATLAYGSTNSSEVENLSSLFHTRDEFSFSQLYENNMLPEALNTLNDITLFPRYSWNEQGVVIGGAVEKTYTGTDHDWRLRITTTLPIKHRVSVENMRGMNAIEESVLEKTVPQGIRDTIQLDTKNKTFVARLDTLIANELLRFMLPGDSSDNILLCYNPGINIGEENNASTINLMDALRGGFITKKIISAVTEETAVFFAHAATTKNNIVTVDGTDYTASPLYNSITADGNYCAIPLTVYNTFSDIKTQPIIETTTSRFVSTFTKEQGLDKPRESFFINSADYNTVYKSNTENITIVSKNDSLRTVEYIQPPFLVISSPNVPKAPNKSYVLTNNTINPSTGMYGDYLTKQNGVNFLKGDGSINNTSGNITTPAVFFYLYDYALLPQSPLLSTLYLTSALTSQNTPTEASEEFYKTLENFLTVGDGSGTKKEITDTIATNEVLQGWFAQPANLDSKITAPDERWNWNEFKKSGIGDLDCQFLFGSTFYHKKLAADLIIGVTAPTGLTVTPLYNYLAVPLGNNGHYQWRLGGQAAFDLTKWARLSGYCHYSWALPSHEMIISPFANAEAYGLQPSTVLANIWWQEFVLSGDLSCFANETTSLALKYQYTLKRQDNISLETTYARSGAGDSELLSPSSLLPNTARRAHKVIGECAIAVNPDCILSFGASEIIAGRNIAREGEFFANIIISF